MSTITNTIWTPQPKQIEFMQRPEYEALYGGAAGGGKSDALIIEALRQVHIPHYKALILRKTYPQLAELIEKSLNYYKQAVPDAKYNDSKHAWTFPSGAKVIFGSMQHTKDRTNYQGQAYDYIAFDELTHFTYEEYSYMFSRNRPNGPGTRVYIRATANPGGIGHGWVKERFITPAPPMTPIIDTVKWETPDGQKQERTIKRIFVPSKVFDNPALLANNPDYIANLAAMPEAEKRALLYGDWDSFSGQVFTEWKNDSEHYDDRLYTHVINPFLIPNNWTVYCSFDWGYFAPFSAGWYAVAPDDVIYRIREFYGCNGTPNMGVRMDAQTVAQEIKRIEREDENLKRFSQIYRVGDPAIWASQGTESTGALMEREGVYFEKADNTRISGKMQVHHRLKFDKDGRPQFQVFNTCKHFIRTFPSLVYSETDVEDVDTHQEDHIYDEFRYICMRNPVTRVQETATLKPYNPLDTEEQHTNYTWYSKY